MKPVGILPLFHIKSRLFGDYLTSVPFAEIGGIVADDESVARAVAEAMKSGMSRKDAAAQVAEAAGLSKRYVYDASLRTRADS
jgi:16S rRNA C1402 (ribose-2'-O) methylase RsmI